MRMVEWKKIEDSCRTITPPKKLEKELYGNKGLYPIIDQGKNDIVGYTDDETALVPINEYVLFGDHTRYVKYYHGKFAQGADGLKILLAADGILPRFLFFSFENTEVPSRGYSRHWSIAKDLLIPVPSLSEQQRIVGILDTFTASIDNLKEQIAQRRKQYEYYRDQLLDLEGKPEVEMKTLGEMTKVLRGKRLTKNMLDEEAPYPVFHGGIEPLGFYSQYNREANTVMIINVGASAGTVGYCDRKFWSSDGCFCISQSDSINNKFLYYYLETKTHYLQSQVRHAGIPTLDNPVVEKIYVPLLTLSEQQRIVSILDTFEASIQNLEAQLKEREKQYEYYRNKLLTFDKI